MRYDKGGFRTKAAAAVKFFFMGDDNLPSQAPSDRKELSSEELDIVAGGRGDRGCEKNHFSSRFLSYGIPDYRDSVGQEREKKPTFFTAPVLLNQKPVLPLCMCFV